MSLTLAEFVLSARGETDLFVTTLVVATFSIAV